MRKRNQHNKSNTIRSLLYNQRHRELTKIRNSSDLGSAFASASAYASAYAEVCKAGVWAINMLVEAMEEG